MIAKESFFFFGLQGEEGVWRKCSSHHETTSSMNCWYKAGWIVIIILIILLPFCRIESVWPFSSDLLLLTGVFHFPRPLPIKTKGRKPKRLDAVKIPVDQQSGEKLHGHVWHSETLHCDPAQFWTTSMGRQESNYVPVIGWLGIWMYDWYIDWYIDCIKR